MKENDQMLIKTSNLLLYFCSYAVDLLQSGITNDVLKLKGQQIPPGTLQVIDRTLEVVTKHMLINDNIKQICEHLSKCFKTSPIDSTSVRQ